jgi:hypothetical protein
MVSNTDVRKQLATAARLFLLEGANEAESEIDNAKGRNRKRAL